MVDTVKLDIPIFLSRRKISTLEWSDLDISKITGQVKGKMYDDIPRITYVLKSDGRSWLKVEVSVPRFLYGHNVKEVTQSDIQRFYQKMRRYLSQRLKLPLSKIPKIECCELEKLHVCHNFQVGSNVRMYLKAMNSIDIPKYQRIPYNAKGRKQQETVCWVCGKSVLKFYDKEEEVKQNKSYRGNRDVQRLAKGILRFEVELSYDEMRKRSPNRLAGELLQVSYLTQTLNDKLKLLGLDKDLKVTTEDMILTQISTSNLDRRTKNSLTSFAVQLLKFGEGHCKSAYSKSSYFRTYGQLKSFLGIDKVILTDVDLPKLSIKKRKRSSSTA